MVPMRTSKLATGSVGPARFDVSRETSAALTAREQGPEIDVVAPAVRLRHDEPARVAIPQRAAETRRRRPTPVERHSEELALLGHRSSVPGSGAERTLDRHPG